VKSIDRAISIRQPYVEQILRGSKRFEYRSRPTKTRERVWLYASARPADDPKAWRQVKAKPGILPTCAVLGSVEILDCSANSAGGYKFRLGHPKRLARRRIPTNQPQPVFWRPRFR
jgi:hypothetical protein